MSQSLDIGPESEVVFGLPDFCTSFLQTSYKYDTGVILGTKTWPNERNVVTLKQKFKIDFIRAIY